MKIEIELNGLALATLAVITVASAAKAVSNALTKATEFVEKNKTKTE